jgi:hypothetical protein
MTLLLERLWVFKTGRADRLTGCVHLVERVRVVGVPLRTYQSFQNPGSQSKCRSPTESGISIP